MVFSSIVFLFYFLPITLVLYFMVPKQFKNLVLLVLSLVFYAWGEPKYIPLIFLSSLVDYFSGRMIAYYDSKNRDFGRKLSLFLSLSMNLGLLSFFKYGDFIISNVNTIFSSNISMLNVALPIGISFYTFQTMSYTIDVYRREVDVQKNFLSFATYVALFPQLIAGPIVRYKTIADELDHRDTDLDMISEGIKRFVIGLAKKVLLANNIGLVWESVKLMDFSNLPFLSALLGISAFSFQIYFDFSAYSDMAIGLGKIFGFNFLENFNYPYMAKSITDFWRRWHISLSSWFKEYVYIPLGGNRKGRSKTLRNIAVVWFLTGLWHGASWNFIMWGLYFGILLILEKLFLLKFLKKLPIFIQHIYTLSLVLISWVLFSFEDLSILVFYMKSLLGMNKLFLSDHSIYLLYTNAILLLVLAFAATNLPRRVFEKFRSRQKRLAGFLENILLLIIFLMSLAYLVDSSYNPFLYFRF